jgi:hypothetical protein
MSVGISQGTAEVKFADGRNDIRSAAFAADTGATCGADGEFREEAVATEQVVLQGRNRLPRIVTIHVREAADGFLDRMNVDDAGASVRAPSPCLACHEKDGDEREHHHDHGSHFHQGHTLAGTTFVLEMDAIEHGGIQKDLKRLRGKGDLPRTVAFIYHSGFADIPQSRKN